MGMKRLVFIVLLMVLGLSILHAEDEALTILVFGKSNCPPCEDIKFKFLPEVKERLGINFEVEFHDTGMSEESLALFLYLQDEYEKNDDKKRSNPSSPTIFVNGKFLYGVNEVKEHFESELLNLTNQQ